MSFLWKKKEVPKSGFMGDTSPEQDAVLNQFRDWVAATEIADLEIYDDYDLLRFCRARKFVLADMQLMFSNFMNWRKDAKVDNIIETFDFAEFPDVQAHYPHGYHKTDKQGRPIYIERMGLLNVPEVFRVSTQERMIRHYVQAYEVLMKLRFPACSAEAGRHIQQGFTILDMTHGSIGTVNSQVRGLVRLASQVGSDYYPEIMGQLYIVNAPMVFAGVWSVVKGFLDERTRKKIKILGTGFRPYLYEMVEKENLPDFLGGDCKCEEFGGCLKSNAGPWNDYEIVKPKGVKKREKYHPDVNGRPIWHDEEGNPILTVKEEDGEVKTLLGPIVQEEEIDLAKEAAAALGHDVEESKGDSKLPAVQDGALEEEDEFHDANGEPAESQQVDAKPQAESQDALPEMKSDEAAATGGAE